MEGAGASDRPFFLNALSIKINLEGYDCTIHLKLCLQTKNSIACYILCIFIYHLKYTQSNTTASQIDIDIDIKGIGLILLSDLTLAFRASTVKENKSINKHINKSSHPKFVGIYCKTNFPNFQSSIQILPISMSIIKKLE